MLDTIFYRTPMMLGHYEEGLCHMTIVSLD